MVGIVVTREEIEELIEQYVPFDRPIPYKTRANDIDLSSFGERYKRV